MAKITKAVENTPAIDLNAKNATNNETPKTEGENVASNEPQKEVEGDKQAAPPAAPIVKPEPTSPKLVELKETLKTAWAKMIGFKDPSSDDALAANLEVYKIRQEIKAEIANIEKIARDQEILEKRNARIQLAQDLLDAIVAENTFFIVTFSPAADVEVTKTDGTTVMQKPDELLQQMNALTHDRKSKFEIVANELAARYATSTPATGTKSVSTDKPAGEKSGQTKSEQIEEMMKAGKTYDDMIAAGMGDGTIRTVSGAIKYKKNTDGTYSPRV